MGKSSNSQKNVKEYKEYKESQPERCSLYIYRMKGEFLVLIFCDLKCAHARGLVTSEKLLEGCVT